jgi:Xaa-Pro aminopeptidase
MPRIDKLRSLMNELTLDGFLIIHTPNIRYLSNFSGSSGAILLTTIKNYFITDFRYKGQSHNEITGFDIRINYVQNAEVKKIIESDGLKAIGFESNRMTYGGYDNLRNNFPQVNFVPVTEAVEKLTMQKTLEEISKIKKAIEITDKTFKKILDFIKPGMKELDVSAEITYIHKKLGALKDAFEPIVASGWRSSLPHGVATNKVIENGDMVTLDFGCVYEGFCSDMTRTVSAGNPPDEMKKIYGIVRDAQAMAIEKAHSSMSSKQLDTVARDYITQKGYGEYFGHGLGHGLGIEVHEMPSLSQRHDYQLRENTVVTVEPGIYIENSGGVRIEDDILLKENGCEVLNCSPNELIVL